MTIHKLEKIIQQRATEENTGSYTKSLLDSGIAKCAQKVGEEAVETVIEAMRDKEELFLGEAADLMYHYLVLLQAKGYSLADIETVLGQRHK